MQQEKLEFFASCLAGFEQYLADELKRLRGRRIRPLHGGVAFFGTAAVAQRVCLWSRLASRVTLVVKRVNAGDASLLYEGIRRIPWHEVIAPGASIAVRAHGMNEELRNTHFTELKVKDGICDALRERTGSRPDVDSANADANIDVRIRDSRATVSLDLSGESLYARPYLEPDAGQDAPLECALSAGVLFLRIVSPFYLVIAVKLIADGVLRGVNRMKLFMTATLTDLVIRVACAGLFSTVLGLGLTGIWLSWPVGWLIAASMSVFFYRTVKRQRFDIPQEAIQPERMAEETAAEWIESQA